MKKFPDQRIPRKLLVIPLKKIEDAPEIIVAITNRFLKYRMKKIFLTFLAFILTSCQANILIPETQEEKRISIRGQFEEKEFLSVEAKKENIGEDKNSYSRSENIDVSSHQQPNFENKKSPEQIFSEFSFQIFPNKKNFQTYLPTLMFHYIKDVDPNGEDTNGYKLSLSPARLEEFLIFFQENNVETLTFWDVKEILEGKKEIPKKAVMLTFDDGYIDHYTNAYRVLEKYNAKGIFFIIGNKPDTHKYYANWEQIIEMSEKGHEIGSHTMTHPSLSSLSIKQIEYELSESQKIISEKIKKPVISLCYPAGKYDERVKDIAEKYYLFARTTQPGKKFSVKNRYEIPTTRMFPTTGIASLKIWFGE